MSEERRFSVAVSFDEATMRRLEACAQWRDVSVEDVARAYVEDWIDIDYPNSQGRLTRRGLHRDGPIGLCEHTRETTSRNWKAEFRERGL